MPARSTPIQNVTVAAVFCNAQVCVCFVFLHRTHTCCLFLEIVTLSKHKEAQKAKADNLATQDDLKCVDFKCLLYKTSNFFVH